LFKSFMSTIRILLADAMKSRSIIILLVIGGLLIILADVLLVQKYRQEQLYKQTLVAQQVQAQLQLSLDEHLSALKSLNVVYQNFVEINHYDFQKYGQTITTDSKGFRRLLYIDPALTIHHIYPLTPENIALYNHSLHDDLQYTTLLKEAKASRDLATSPMIDTPKRAKSVIAAIPLYRDNKEFIGYAAGELDLGEIWKTADQKAVTGKYQVQLYDENNTPFISGKPFNLNDPLQTTVPLRVGDKEWLLAFLPIDHFLESVIILRLEVWSAGVLILFLIVVLITATKEHKLTLGHAQRKFEMIFEASPVGMMLLNDTLKPQMANPAVQSWLGEPGSELRRKTFFDLFTCQCPNLEQCRELSFLLCTSQHFEGELPESLEAKVNHPVEGGPRLVRLNASRLQPAGNISAQSGFICILDDISTLKELENEKENFVATLTHDLKTPLLAQRLLLENILSGKMGPVPENQEKALTGASESVKDLLDMVYVTLLYYKLASSSLNLHRQEVVLPTLVKEVMEVVRPLLVSRELSLELETAMEVPNVWVDPLQMKRVVQNLLSNAISYARQSSVISVNIGCDEDGMVLLTIRNEGKGISPEELAKVFDRYYSLSNKFKKIGAGLGLYIARRLVELHGGRIWAESEVDQETRFHIKLPTPQAL
jgi:signal transduction histidine kinase/sensor domain CHASE-containing protein